MTVNRRDVWRTKRSEGFVEVDGRSGRDLGGSERGRFTVGFRKGVRRRCLGVKSIREVLDLLILLLSVKLHLAECFSELVWYVIVGGDGCGRGRSVGGRRRCRPRRAWLALDDEVGGEAR